ncbi:MAG: iron dicitrate transport regulator FecR, partial [Candidatus Nephrothrix sp. EaCA]
FEGAPVIEIFKALEVSYGVEIKYDKDKISNCILTVSLEGEDLFMRLQVVCNAINGKYRIDETRVIISSPGCG